MVNANEVKLTSKNDFKALLKPAGLWDSFLTATLRCEFCNCIITYRNLAALFTYNGKNAVICSNYICYKEFLGYCIKKTIR
jgi:hypothetical protein